MTSHFFWTHPHYINHNFDFNFYVNSVSAHKGRYILTTLYSNSVKCPVELTVSVAKAWLYQSDVLFCMNKY